MPRGFRAFRVSLSENEAFLAPANGLHTGQTPLEFPMTRAICSRGKEHLAPGADCTCGYYAYSDLGGACQWMRPGEAWVMAEVWGHGHVQLHELGWRAEKLQIIRFFAPICDTQDGCDEAATVCWDPDPNWKDVALWPGRFACPTHDGLRLRIGQGSLGELTTRSVPVEDVMCWLAAKFGAEIVGADATRAAYKENAEWRAEVKRQDDLKRAKFYRQRAHDYVVKEAKSRAVFAKYQASVRMPGLDSDPLWDRRSVRLGEGGCSTGVGSPWVC